MKYKRIFLIILDSLGIGATKDADKFGDGMANSLMNTIQKNKVELPNFRSLGLFKLTNDEDDEYKTLAYYTKALPNTKIKCSVLNHFEMMGSIMNKNYSRFDLSNLDKDLLNYIETEIDRKIIISDTFDNLDMINNYGAKQIKTGSILMSFDYYNLKVMSHESVIPIKELTKIGKLIMDILYSKGFFINKMILNTFSGSNVFSLNSDKTIITFSDKKETVLERMKKKVIKLLLLERVLKYLIILK